MPSPRLDDLLPRFQVTPGKRLKLEDHDPGWSGDASVPKAERKEFARTLLSEDVSTLAEAQELLYASDKWAVLVLFQAMDAAGKDGTIKHVMSGINPQGCQVFSFKQPSAEELDHDFMWRYNRALPERGRLGIFNRSYYEEVLVVRVHPEWIQRQRIPDADPADPGFWKARFEAINNFEKRLTSNGTLVVKFFLNVSRQEQKERFLERLENPEKHWKFSAADLTESGYWDQYMSAYEDALSATSTKWAPWYVIPADRKWVTRALVAAILTRQIQGLQLAYPEVTPAQKQEIEAARQALGADVKKQRKNKTKDGDDHEAKD